MKRLGLGLMRFPLLDSTNDSSVDVTVAKDMIDRFMKRGFTYFDTAYVYHGGKSEGIFGELVAKRYPRDSYTISTKMPVWQVKEESEYEKIFAEQLERCCVDYFDYYFLHSLDDEVYETEIGKKSFEFIKKKKAEGKVKKMCFSFHDTAEVLDKILTENPEMEMVLLQINYVDWEDEKIQSRLCYEVCIKHGKEVAIMEPVKGGNLANLPEKAQSILKGVRPDMSCASWGIRFAASLDNVHVVLSGMSSVEQIEDNMNTMDNFEKLTEAELKAVEETVSIINDSIAVPCTSCRYCVEGCPKKIDIPKYFDVYNKQNQFGLQPRHQGDFNSVTKNGGKPSECIGCKQCENHCPQHLHIIEELKKVAEIFEK